MGKASGNVVVYFDERCNLCRASVRFIARRDARQRFQFCPLQSPDGQAIMAATGLDPAAPGSIVLQIADDQLYLRSAAALRIALRLKAPWPLLGVFLVIPAPLRDPLYRWIARNRYRWFGVADGEAPTEEK